MSSRMNKPSFFLYFIISLPSFFTLIIFPSTMDCLCCHNTVRFETLSRPFIFNTETTAKREILHERIIRQAILATLSCNFKAYLCALVQSHSSLVLNSLGYFLIFLFLYSCSCGIVFVRINRRWIFLRKY